MSKFVLFSGEDPDIAKKSSYEDLVAYLEKITLKILFSCYAMKI
jgi:hypothetical protein